MEIASRLTKLLEEDKKSFKIAYTIKIPLQIGDFMKDSVSVDSIGRICQFLKIPLAITKELKRIVPQDPGLLRTGKSSTNLSDPFKDYNILQVIGLRKLLMIYISTHKGISATRLVDANAVFLWYKTQQSYCKRFESEQELPINIPGRLAIQYKKIFNDIHDMHDVQVTQDMINEAAKLVHETLATLSSEELKVYAQL
tara:strand:+ start:338 stop:931 length:594 start_codon:yes stop_codon:yes gene_type:complete